MPAAATDKLMEVGSPGTATTLSAPGYTIGDGSITVGSTTNWPTATGVCFSIYEVETVAGESVMSPGTYNEYYGTVASSTSITNVSHVTGSGTNRNYSAGASTIVTILVSSGRENRIVEWGTAEHAQDGTHTDITADSVTINASGSVDFSNAPLATADIADDAVTAAKINFGGSGAGVWWEEIARTTLGSAGDTITVSGIPARKYLKIIMTSIDSSQTSPAIRFNGDTGSNYAYRVAQDGSADSTSTSQTSLLIGGSATANGRLITIDAINISSQEKVFVSESVFSGTAGAGTAPTKRIAYGKWANTSDQISSVTFTNAGTGDFGIGSEVVVLGHD